MLQVQLIASPKIVIVDLTPIHRVVFEEARSKV
jgi:hypothetical protein